MSVKELIERVEEEVQDVLNTGFKFSGATSVPNYDDSGLTYESGEIKKGKELETCVLYADIRNSVKLNEDNDSETMGQLYTAFTKAVLRAAEKHEGSVRNIIGDRVMVVFPPTLCFKNAVDCAVSINHIASKIINPSFTGLTFKCGIGIDYGPMKVLKVGVERRGKENKDNKNLVWVGGPANIASRLTDVANKTTEEEYYEVKRYPINPRSNRNPDPITSLLRIVKPDEFGYDSTASKYCSFSETVEMSKEEFAENIYHYSDGSLYMIKGKNISFEKKKRDYTYEPILVTKDIFEGLKQEDPNRNSLVKNLWKEETRDVENVSSEILGSNLYWEFNDE